MKRFVNIIFLLAIAVESFTTRAQNSSLETTQPAIAPELAALIQKAEQGDAYAQSALGTCYRYGFGVTKNYAKAVEWFRKAAEQGYAITQYNLGLCYENGEGVTKSKTEAVKWFRKAARQGDEDAQRALRHLGESW